MPRPKPDVPVDVPFHARTTRGERDALETLLARKTERLRAVEPTAPGMDMVGWFRSVLRREAAAEGITITEPTATLPPAVEASKPKPSAKRKTK
jgi:hypothetical protein